MSTDGGFRARRSGLGEEEHENGERWLLTYADMITLLLALFMVLFALSSVSANKFAAFKSGLVSAFHSSAQTSPTKPGGQGLLQQTSLTQKPMVIPHPQVSTSLSKLEAALRKALQREHLQSSVSMDLTSNGLTIRVLTDKVFFSSGRAALQPQGGKLVDAIGKVVAKVPNRVQVRGYTDNVPVAGGQLGNFDLSSSRANTVVRRLNTIDRVPLSRLSSAGYGPNNPVASNRTAAGRAHNRRVDIVVLNGTDNGS